MFFSYNIKSYKTLKADNLSLQSVILFIFLPFRMRKLFKKLINHIFRSWEDEPNPPHPQMKFIPPFFLELLAYLIGLSILYQIGAYLYGLI